MFKTVTTSIFLAAITAGAAQSEQIRINVVGKDETAVRAEIRQAATRLCRAGADATPLPIELNPEVNCRRRAVRAAEADLAAIQLARSGERLAAR